MTQFLFPALNYVKEVVMDKVVNAYPKRVTLENCVTWFQYKE